MVQWAIGIADGPSSNGALAFAHWWATRGNVWASMPPDGLPPLVAIHVLDARRHPYTPTLVDEVRPRIQAHLDDAGLSTWVEGPYLPFAPQPVDALLSEATARSVEALIVGREGGSTARHLLRLARLPLVFVPEHTPHASASPGPVLVVVDQLQPIAATLAWARARASELGRSIRIAHGFPQLDDDHPLPTTTDATEAFAALGPAWSARYATWAALHEHPTEPITLLTGHVTRTLVEDATTRRAAMLVCATRHPSLMERVFNPAVGPIIAAHSDRPVAVVPEVG